MTPLNKSSFPGSQQYCYVCVHLLILQGSRLQLGTPIICPEAATLTAYVLPSIHLPKIILIGLTPHANRRLKASPQLQREGCGVRPDSIHGS